MKSSTQLHYPGFLKKAKETLSRGNRHCQGTWGTDFQVNIELNGEGGMSKQWLMVGDMHPQTNFWVLQSPNLLAS